MKKMQLAAYVLGAGLGWGLAAQAMAVVAGKVDSLSGSVYVSRNGAAGQLLTTGASVNEGDLLSTGADSWALLEMADGGSLTLRGNTRLRIDAYVYAQSETTASKSWLSLLEGAMRSVTGAIGAFNPPSYRLTTPVVTLGIRGTDHETAYYPPGSTEPGVEPGVYDKVNQGETYMHTQRGDVNLKAGQAGFSDHRGASAPRVLAAIPAFYKRHAQIDRRLANRMRLIQTRREKKIETIRQHMQHRTGTGGGETARPQQNHAGTKNGELRREHPRMKQDSARREASKTAERGERAKRLPDRRTRQQEQPR